MTLQLPVLRLRELARHRRMCVLLSSHDLDLSLQFIVELCALDFSVGDEASADLHVRAWWEDGAPRWQLDAGAGVQAKPGQPATPLASLAELAQVLRRHAVSEAMAAAAP